MHAEILGNLRKYEKNERWQQHLPEQAIRHQAHVTVVNMLAARHKNPIAAPAQNRRDKKMENDHNRLPRIHSPGHGAQQTDDNTGQRCHIKKQHKTLDQRQR